jgi:hypothetical protein
LRSPVPHGAEERERGALARPTFFDPSMLLAGMIEIPRREGHAQSPATPVGCRKTSSLDEPLT